MAQNTFNDGDTLLQVQSVVNGNATDAEPRLQKADTIVITGDGDKFKSDDGTYKVPPESGTTSMRAESGTTPPPDSGKVRWNNATQTSATTIYLSETSDEGSDLTSYLSGLEIGDGIYFQNSTDAGHFQSWDVDAVVDSGGHKTITANLMQSGGGNFSTSGQGQLLLVTIKKGAGTLQALKEASQNASSQTPVIGTAIATDLLVVWDNDTKQQKLIYSRDLVAANSLECFVRGSGASIIATSTYTALPIFGTQVDSTSANLVKSVDDTGVTAGIPVKYEVNIDMSLEAATNVDLFFAIFADGVIASRELQFSGAGNGKFRNASFRGIADFSGLTPPATKKIELRVRNNGDTITSINADMLVKFIS